MQVIRLTTHLLVAMALAVIFLGREPGEVVHRPDTRTAKAEPAPFVAKPAPAATAEDVQPDGSYEVASIGSLDGLISPVTAEPESAPDRRRYVVGTPVVFSMPEIRTDYVLADAPPDMRRTEPVARTEGADVVFVTGTRVNLRQGPSTEAQVLATLVKGDEAEVVGDAQSGWMNIRDLKSGAVGYMSADFLASAAP